MSASKISNKNFTKNKEHKLNSNRKESSNDTEEQVFKVDFLELKENNDDSVSVNSINSQNIENISKKPLLLDYALPRPKTNNLNDNNNKFSVKSARNKPENRIFTGELENITYEGKIKGTDIEPSKYFIGVLSKKRKKISLLPVDYITINAKIKSLHSDNNNNTFLNTATYLNSTFVNPSDNKDITEKQGNYLNNKSLLVQDFGTSKSQKVIESMKSNIIKEENISSVKAMNEIIQKNTKEGADDKKDSKSGLTNDQEASLKNILPEFDVTTRDIMKMFNVDTIIDEKTIRSISFKDALSLITNNTISQHTLEYSAFTLEYFKDFFAVLQNNKYSNINLNIQYGLYLDILIRFYTQPKIVNKSLEHLANDLKSTPEIAKHLLNKYTMISYNEGRPRYIRTAELLLKSFYHCLILAFYLKQYSMDMDPLCLSLKIDQKEMLSKLKLFNCAFPQIKKEVTGDGKKIRKINKFVAEIKAPLKFNVEPSNLKKR